MEWLLSLILRVMPSLYGGLPLQKTTDSMRERRQKYWEIGYEGFKCVKKIDTEYKQ